MSVRPRLQCPSTKVLVFGAMWAGAGGPSPLTHNIVSKGAAYMAPPSAFVTHCTLHRAMTVGDLSWDVRPYNAELSFVGPYWPAFRRVDLLRALRDYTGRQRRFGS